ncbi:MAG TPA: carboxypeptidase regulatory-like domain-containing protein [Pyrinomonadaceae bacterium]|nr:carboxypeptidase regulatory-like domain-containing protein [Pyrinomonadaceae bacterium]
MSFARVRRIVALLLAVALLSLMFAACSSDEDEGEDNANEAGVAAGPKYTPSGNEGQITGTIALSGTAPAPAPISMDADAACAQNNPNPHTETVVAKDGKLANVFVYIKDGKTADGKTITTMSWDVPATEVVLDQKGCHYIPHVLGVMAGQKLKITNSDQTAHNVHPLPKSNPEWNQSQPSGSAPLEKSFARPEVVVPVKCNQHPWMKAFIGVMRSPLYAVSTEDGRFTITGVPPGTYTVAALHELYGEKTMQVTVGAKEVKTQDFSYDATKPASAMLEPFGGALRIEPALEVPMPMAMKH